MRLAENTGCENCQKFAIWAPLHNFVTLYLRNSTKTRIDNRKKLVKQQYFLTCPYNMANFSPLAAEVGSLVWCPANFNGFRVLAALLHGTLVAGVSQTLRR